jgi:hypothetical protein
MSVLRAAEIFADVNATSKIVCASGGSEAVYNGYTDLLNVKKDRYNGRVSVALQKSGED